MNNMNEMLGNQKFLVRKFKEAASHFEKALLLDPFNQSIRKKLIICYIHEDEVELAFRLFCDLVKENVRTILETDVIKDDCPCKDLIAEIESSSPAADTIKRKKILGMLWLYCDMLESKKYFEELMDLEPDNAQYAILINRLNNIYTTNYRNKHGKERTN